MSSSAAPHGVDEFLRVEPDLSCVTQANLSTDADTSTTRLDREWVVLNARTHDAMSEDDARMAEVYAAQTAAVLHEQSRAGPSPTLPPPPPPAATATVAQPEPTTSGLAVSASTRRCECLGASAGIHRPACSFGSVVAH